MKKEEPELVVGCAAFCYLILLALWFIHVIRLPWYIMLLPVMIAVVIAIAGFPSRLKK